MSIIKFTETHEWVRLEADGSATVGITDFAQEQLGDIVFIQLPPIGKHFQRGSEVAMIESVKAAGEIKLPVSGSILEVNSALDTEPALANSAPLDQGWFFRINVEHPDELNALMDEAAYQQLITI